MTLSRPRKFLDLLRDLGAARRAVSTVEFAINSLLLMLFLIAIIDFGDLGLVLGTMKQAVETSARDAAVETADNFAQSGIGAACASGADMTGYFNSIASPILPPASTTAHGGAPLIQYAWTNNSAADSETGTFLTITASYSWSPIGMANLFGPGIRLSLSSTQMVIGTSGWSTSCT